jgi:hypothetical protein
LPDFAIGGFFLKIKFEVLTKFSVKVKKNLIVESPVVNSIRMVQSKISHEEIHEPRTHEGLHEVVVNS